MNNDILFNIITLTEDPNTLYSLNMTNKYLNNLCKQKSFWDDKYTKYGKLTNLRFIIFNNYLTKYQRLYLALNLTERLVSFSNDSYVINPLIHDEYFRCESNEIYWCDELGSRMLITKEELISKLILICAYNQTDGHIYHNNSTIKYDYQGNFINLVTK